MSTSQRSTFAQMVQLPHFPTKEEAIILDAVDGVTIQDYATVIGKMIDPKNIRFVSRISHGRVCLYLSNKDIVDRLTVKPTKVNILTHELEIRPLIAKARRIILSNVCPIIPHSIILEELAKINIHPTSQMLFIKAGMNEPGYSHVLSFRRQIYLKPEDVSKLPETMQINYDDTNYWIYFSTKKLSCFLCKQEGHVAKFCKNIDASDKVLSVIPDGVENNLTHTKNSKVEIKESAASTSTEENKKDHSFAQPSPMRSKRLLSPLSNVRKNNNHEKLLDDKNKCKFKKIKRSPKQKITCEEIANSLIPASELFTHNVNKYPLSFDQLIEFLFTAYENHNAKETAIKYTEDIAKLISMIFEIKQVITERKIKIRITKIIKSLQSTSVDMTSGESSALDDTDN